MDKRENHTPAPWRYSKPHSHIGHEVETDSALICLCCHHPEKPEASEANARRIVRCVNAHDNLVAALELLYEHCRLYHRDVERNNVGAVVRAALAKAKGETE